MKPVQFRVARPTNQLKKVVRFYEEGLGLTVIGSFEDHEGYTGVILSLPLQNSQLEFTQHEKEHPSAAPTRDNLLVFYFEKHEDYISAIEGLKKMGISPVEPDNPYWKGKSETFEDPDGWRVVLYNGIY